MTIEYTKIGDYYFPNVKLDEQSIKLSKYGRMKLKHLKEHQKGLYFKLITTNELNGYLQTIDKEANELYDRLLIDLKKQRRITEKLKEENQMLWVQEMSNILNYIDEVILKKYLTKIRYKVKHYVQ